MVDLAVASADSAYFNEFGISFFMSCLENDQPCAINVIDPDNVAVHTLQEMSRKAFSANFHFVESISASGLSNTASHMDRRVHYACDRLRFTSFLFSNLLRGSDHGSFMIDIDSIFRKKLDFPPDPLYIFMRDGYIQYDGVQITDEFKLLASAMVRYSQKDYIDDCLEYIKTHNPFWGLDQLAMWECLTPERKTLVKDMEPDNVLDWHFRKNSYIWYPKGPRKNHPKFKTEKTRLESLF